VDSLTLTYALAVAHLVLRGITLWLTRRPFITVFHVALAITAVAFGVRPLVCALEGGAVLYGAGENWAYFNMGLLYQLLFDVAFIGGYSLDFRRTMDSSTRVVVSVTWESVLGVAAVGVATLVAIHVLSSGAWLPTERNQAMTMLIPGGPVLFRLAVISLSVTIPLTAVLYFRRRRQGLWLAVLLAFVALVGLSLLYQRGMVLVGVVVAAWIAERQRKLRYGRVCLAVMSLMLAVGYLRPLAAFVSVWATGKVTDANSGITSSPDPGVRLTAVSEYLKSYCEADIWLVAGGFVEQNGYIGGKGLVATPAVLTPPSFRFRTGWLTTNNVLNYSYFGERYRESQFGFTVNLAQNVFVNLGPAFLWLGLIPGVLTARVDRWLRTESRMNEFSVFAATAAFVTGGFIGDASVMSYGLAYLLVGGAFSILIRRGRGVLALSENSLEVPNWR
jgi:hypothetical protein